MQNQECCLPNQMESAHSDCGIGVCTEALKDEASNEAHETEVVTFNANRSTGFMKTEN